MDVLYLEFPPYYYTNKAGEPDGFLLKRASEIFSLAGMEATFRSVPAKRALEEVRFGKNLVSVGWFRTAERERFARFSRPIYRNLPLQALYLKKNSGLFEGVHTLESLLTCQTLVFGYLDGYSYGTFVDVKLERAQMERQEVVGGFQQLVRMLAAERFDYILVAPEEANALIARNGLDPNRFLTRELVDIPEGNARYLMFSDDVGPEVLDAVNRVIDALGPAE